MCYKILFTKKTWVSIISLTFGIISTYIWMQGAFHDDKYTLSFGVGLLFCGYVVLTDMRRFIKEDVIRFFRPVAYLLALVVQVVGSMAVGWAFKNPMIGLLVAVAVFMATTVLSAQARKHQFKVF